MARLLQMLIALDCLALSILTFGDHYRGATVSAALWAPEQEGKWRGRVFRPVVDLLFRPIEPRHCEVAWFYEAYLRKPSGSPSSLK